MKNNVLRSETIFTEKVGHILPVTSANREKNFRESVKQEMHAGMLAAQERTVEMYRNVVYTHTF